MRRFHQSHDGPGLIHTVELSDASDPRHFVTLWLKGQVGTEWALAEGLSDHHDPDVYHTGEGNYGWLPLKWPGKESQGWSKHRHIDLPWKPRLEDVSRYYGQMGPGLARQLELALAES